MPDQTGSQTGAISEADLEAIIHYLYYGGERLSVNEIAEELQTDHRTIKEAISVSCR